jgi:hypothetical protein
VRRDTAGMGGTCVGGSGDGQRDGSQDDKDPTPASAQGEQVVGSRTVSATGWGKGGGRCGQTAKVAVP